VSELRHLHIDAYKDRYHLRSFVETGVHMGNGLEYALALGFAPCLSCDIMPQYVAAARERFGDDVSVMLSDSLWFLRSLPAGIGPSLFWLDAHFPKHYDLDIPESADNRYPIMQEIGIIKQRQDYAQGVIIVDDLIVLRDSPRWNEGEICDYFQVGDFTFKELLMSLVDTHTAEIDLQQEGTVRFLPRRPLGWEDAR
jgi:hypothetical protein